MGPYKPLRNWVDEFIPYYMEIMGVDRPDRTPNISTQKCLESSSSFPLMSLTGQPTPPGQVNPPEIAGVMIRAY